MMVRERKIEVMHNELQNWKSYLLFIEDEMAFIQRLLDSYVFEPRTPNLFERSENFKQHFNTSKQDRESLSKSIKIHENGLGGIFECVQDECDAHYYDKHQNLKDKVKDYVKSYIKLKKEVYNYAGTVLKKKKPLS
ncbi:hypothetical protein PY092_17345 [Muricauda sp. 334s03]|uniref:Four helix bundle protein n=1 Tax=Flagellimonas yonaguniensis TaxID=3031325 RepID=A0ABT5Y3A1_9FLAO|nr:hypothetical protein [[Muricauda] yonaguniensis]MDF0717933.1 hypothetical protein [[Muricauda] yonaguniensis]